MDRQTLLAQFETLLPVATDWAAEQERGVLREGVPLSEQEIADAKAAGVLKPESVRLLRVECVPIPINPKLKAAAEAIHFLTPETRGLTLQHAIFVRWDCWRETVAHRA